MEFLVKPAFDAIQNALYFPVGRLNALAEGEYNDKMGFYQSTFGMYSYMTLTQDQTYRIHYPKGTPFLFQPHNNCAWTPTGTLSMGEFEITPCRAKINEQFCYDEHMEGTYKAFLQWDQGGRVGFSEAGRAATDALTRTIVANATMGARMTLEAGQLIDLSSVTFKEGTATRIEEAYRKTAGTCRGWIELARTKAQTENLPHLDGGWIKAADISNDGKSFVGDNRTIIDLYDEMVANAPEPLADAIIEGGIGGFGNTYYAMWLLAPPEYRAVYEQWKVQKESAALEDARIERRQYTYQTAQGPRTIYVFFIDDTVVIPISSISQFDRWLTGTAHFAYLTISGVIQMGSNFAGLPVARQNDVGVMIQVSQNAEDLGTHKFLSHALMATGINDTDYIAGDYLFAEPA